MKYTYTTILALMGLLFSSSAFAVPIVDVECWFEQENGKGDARCHVEAEVCIPLVTGEAAVCDVEVEVQCTNGFELEDDHARLLVRPGFEEGVILGSEKRRNRKDIALYARQANGGNEVPARLLTVIGDGEEVDFFHGRCEYELPVPSPTDTPIH